MIDSYAQRVVVNASYCSNPLAHWSPDPVSRNMTQSPCFREWQSRRNQSLIHRNMRRQKCWFRLINEAVGLVKLEKIYQVPRMHSLVACWVLRRINSHTERFGQRGEFRWRQKASEFIFQEVDAELFVDSSTNSTSVNDIERPLLIIISNLDVLRVWYRWIRIIPSPNTQ